MRAQTSVVVLCYCVLSSNVVAENITYHLIPAQIDDHLVSGTITTDGTLGILAEVSARTVPAIVDFNVEVIGPHPFTFTPSNSRQQVFSQAIFSVGMLEATATELLLRNQDEENLPSTKGTWFTIYTETDLGPRVTWSRLDLINIDGSKVERSNSTSYYSPSVEPIRHTETVTAAPFVFARVPEPSTAVLSVLCFLSMLVWRRPTVSQGAKSVPVSRRMRCWGG